MSAPEDRRADSTGSGGTSAVRSSDGDGTTPQSASFDAAPELFE